MSAADAGANGTPLPGNAAVPAARNDRTQAGETPAFPGSRPPALPWLITLATVPSTNTWAIDHHQALAHGAVVVTPRQTSGRGRGGKTWVAPPGVLTASCVLHLPTDTGQLALAAGLAVVHAVEDLAPGSRIGIKWPNDLLIGRRKLAGILVERPSPTVAVVGIGLNLDPDPVDPAWATVRELGATDLTTNTILSAIRRYLLEAAGLLAQGGFPALLPALRERDVLAGRAVMIEDGGRTLAGTAEGLDDQGRLLLDGTPLVSGSVTAWDT